eukprot:gene3338-6605_t
MAQTEFQQALERNYSDNPNYEIIIKMCEDRKIITHLNVDFTSVEEGEKDMLLQALGLELFSDYKVLVEKLKGVSREERINMESLLQLESLSDIFCNNVIQKWNIAKQRHEAVVVEINRYFTEEEEKKTLTLDLDLDWSFVKLVAKCNLLSDSYCEFHESLKIENESPLAWIGAGSFMSRNELILELNNESWETFLNMTTADRIRMSSQLLTSKTKESALKYLSDYNIVKANSIITDPIKVREDSFHEDFVDHLGLLERFHQHIEMCISLYNDVTRKYLSPYIAICQASGMGKSRLIKEYAGINPVAYFSFSAGSSYLPRTPVVIDALLGHIRTNSHIQLIFETFIICAALKVLLIVNNDQKDVTSKSCKEVFDCQVPAPVHSTSTCSDSSDHFWKWNELNNAPEFPSSYIEMQKSTSAKWKKKTAFIVLDEARCLVDEIECGSSLFRHFRRALKSADIKLRRIGLRVFGIVMDTASSVADFTPVNDPCAREVEMEVLLLPPFYTITTMNCLADTSWPKSLSDAFSIRRLATYGRPLIAKFLNKTDDDNPNNDNEGELLQYMILRILSMSKCSPDQYDSMTESEKIAVLCSRITLNITNTSQLADSLSSKHLRVITRVSDNGKQIYTITPSEPVLSEAAYEIMSGCPNQETFIECLHRQLYMGGIVPGFTGEIVSQYLMILTRDKAVSASNKSEPFSTFTVRDFLKAINNCVIEMEKDEVTSEREDKPLTPLPPICNGIMSFNHFTEVKYTPSIRDLTTFFLRMSAVQCKTGQPGIDLIIPVLLPEGKYTHTDCGPKPSKIGTKGHNDDLFNFCKVFTESSMPGSKFDVKNISEENKKLLNTWNSFQRPYDDNIPGDCEMTPDDMEDRMSFILIQVRNKTDDGKSKDVGINPFYANIVRNKNFKNPYVSMAIVLRGEEEEGDVRVTSSPDNRVLHIGINSLQSFSFLSTAAIEMLLKLLDTSPDPLPFFNNEAQERFEIASLSPVVYKTENKASFLAVAKSSESSTMTPVKEAAATSTTSK